MTRALRRIVLVLLAIYPAGVVWLSTASGVGLSQDSVSYLSSARSLGSGAGLITFTGTPLTLFPPVLPILLGEGEAFGWSAVDSARVLNAGCAVLVVLGTYLLAGLCGLGPAARLVPTAVVSLSAAFLGVFAWLWTEPLFTVLVIATLVGLAWAIQARRLPWWLVIAVGGAASAAAGVRYIGLILSVLVPLGAWLAVGDRGRRAWLGRAVAGTALALGLPAVVALRNLSLGAGPLGDRSPGSRTLQGALGETVDILGSFLAPPGSTQLTALAGAAALVLVAAGSWWAFLVRRRSALLVAAYVALYAAVITWSQAATRLDAPSARLLAPAIPAAAVLAVLGARWILASMRAQVAAWALRSPSKRIHDRGGALVGGALVGVCVLVLAVCAAAALSATARLVHNGPEGSLTSVAESSPLAQATAQLPGGVGIAANDPWSVYLARGNPPVLALPPSPTEWPPDRVAADTEALVTAVVDGRVSYAAVSTQGAAITPLSDLEASGIRATEVASLPDGVLYRLESSP